ncbi:hypothetical protein BI364_08930 [Acidihalobacter yilgarnensis]|uniref:Secreted protein n=1 Tax=Acidihalobacter yilgarnensis TaxID=2819280 RepID=A0A1D8INM2_9GAMM|nr:hypothetical protein [Acidihalobacter yilgarnensis]AOU98070.1 hypothetical protein BI364_08930 [Acidihalobacter yilgarnensis]
MTKRYLPLFSLLSIFAISSVIPQYALAAGANLECKMHFKTTSWSAIYKHVEGGGLVTCTDGSSMHVKITARGVGLTAGKFHIDNGVGTFTDVHHIDDVLGSYAQGEANAGLGKSGSAQVLTKGAVSLALAGSGHGVDLGVSVGKFTISRVK